MPPSYDLCPEDVWVYVRHRNESAIKKDRRQNNRDDWEAMARVLDRLFAGLYTLLIVASKAILVSILKTKLTDTKKVDPLVIIRD